MNAIVPRRLLVAVLVTGLWAALAAAPLVGLFFGPVVGTAAAKGLEGLKIGVVNVNQALNESAAGQRSKNILLAAKSQLENELKSKEANLKKMHEGLQNNLMLTNDARAAKEKEIQEQEAELRREVQDAQRQLQERERKLTESIFSELHTVIEAIARDDKYDLVLEKNAANVILFATAKFEDLTAKVIERYNKFNAGK